ncbi:MAG: biotin/lipoyl-binding protein [Marinilabiliaceae bacterium]|nr:biotin/lipoyl-binding protein [Marinilabiliaceae bacterium]
MENTHNIELVDFPILVRKYKTTLTKKYMNRKFYTAPNPNEIKSHIPGTVVKIYVKEGQKVKLGKKIMTLEAMKMVNEIVMPFDGTIEKIFVKEGEKIPKGVVMIEISE